LAIGLNLENTSQTNSTYSPFITFSRKSDSGIFSIPYASLGAQRTGVGGDANWNAGDLVFATNPIGSSGLLERMRITDAGNVGIGTASPAELLDVAGRVHLAQTTAPGATTDKLYNVAGTLYWNGTALGGGGGGTPGGSTKQIQFNSSGAFGASANFNWDNINGRLGIGTAAPNNLLHVNSGLIEVQNTTLSTTPTVISDNGGLFLSGHISEGRIQAYSPSSTAFLTFHTETAGAATSERMRIDGAGNVGIGTAAPIGGLQVAIAPVASASSAVALIGSNWSTGNAAGTMLGVNVPGGFTGNMMDIQSDGMSF
jgi:hypothetical protein